MADYLRKPNDNLSSCLCPQTKVPRCFISYCWSNSERAVKQGTRDIPGTRGAVDPRDIKDYLEEHEISCWIDIEQTGKVLDRIEMMPKSFSAA